MNCLFLLVLICCCGHNGRNRQGMCDSCDLRERRESGCNCRRDGDCDRNRENRTGRSCGCDRDDRAGRSCDREDRMNRSCGCDRDDRMGRDKDREGSCDCQRAARREADSCGCQDTVPGMNDSAARPYMGYQDSTRC